MSATNYVAKDNECTWRGTPTAGITIEQFLFSSFKISIKQGLLITFSTI